MLTGHAHLASGRAEDVAGALALLREGGIETMGNPDLYVRRYGLLGVEEARDIAARASMRPFRTGRVFVLAADSITAEAQNALLKTLEEPSEGALFIIIHPAPDTLLPTLRSRAQPLALPSQKAQSGALDADAFLEASPAKRLELLKPLLEKGEDDKRDVGEMVAFLSALERSLAKRKEKREGLRALYRARRYLGDRGALVKPLLEQVALLV